jgi:uncharacterized protein (DUF305 family)
MNKNIIIIGIFGVVVGVILTLLISQYIVGGTRVIGMRQQAGMNNSRVVNNIDRHFIDQMIPHHEDAITMAKLAQTKSQRPEIKELAMNIIDSQSHEITQMKVLYKTWFGTDVPADSETMKMHGMGQGGMHMGMMGDETDIDALENADDFDKEFIEQMIPHHQMAIMMANMLLNSTERKEMETLAQNIIKAQTKEINDMRSWHAEWYQ